MNTRTQSQSPTKPETNEIDDVKSRLPLPDLMKKLRLGDYAKPSCRSPFRHDQNPSWGIFERDGRWFWKDLGTNESGDEITFLARYLGLKEDFDFPTLLHIYKHFAEGRLVRGSPVSNPTDTQKPNRKGFGKGSSEQLARLSALRGIRVAALELAHERDFLVFGQWHGHEVFGVTDASGRILEVRRLDGQMFPAEGSLSDRKSHAVRYSQKAWPIGILHAKDRAMIMLVEGLPDFLAAHQIILDEGAVDRVAPVAMLSANVQIHKDAQELFRGKQVRMFPHSDDAGRHGAAQWQQQLLQAGATKVDFVDFSLANVEGKAIKDLNDFLPVHDPGYRNDPNQGRLL